MGCGNLLSRPNSNHCLETTVYRPSATGMEVELSDLLSRMKVPQNCGTTGVELRKISTCSKSGEKCQTNTCPLFTQLPPAPDPLLLSPTPTP